MTKENVKYMIDLMPDEKFNEFAAKIIAFFPIDEKLTDEERENEELTKLVEARVAKYGSFEEMFKHCISEEELMSELGITEEDIENAEEDELI
jgi:DNA-binding protein H-NS